MPSSTVTTGKRNLVRSSSPTRLLLLVGVAVVVVLASVLATSSQATSAAVASSSSSRSTTAGRIVAAGERHQTLAMADGLAHQEPPDRHDDPLSRRHGHSSLGSRDGGGSQTPARDEATHRRGGTTRRSHHHELEPSVGDAAVDDVGDGGLCTIVGAAVAALSQEGGVGVVAAPLRNFHLSIPTSRASHVDTAAADVTVYVAVTTSGESCADESVSDAVELWAHSKVAMLQPAAVRRLSASDTAKQASRQKECATGLARVKSGHIRLYRATFVAYEAAEYSIAGAVRYACGAQFETLHSSTTTAAPNHDDDGETIATAATTVVKKSSDRERIEQQLWSTNGFGKNLVAKWSTPRCLIDESLFAEHVAGGAKKASSDSGRFPYTANKQVTGGYGAQVKVVVDARHVQPALDRRPSCTSSSVASAPESLKSVPGRWVNLRRLSSTTTEGAGDCRAPYCTGDYAMLAAPDEKLTANQQSGKKVKAPTSSASSSSSGVQSGWVYVPATCHLHYPESAERAWRHLRGKTMVVLGDSTTSDTLYHLLRVVLQSPSTSPPKNRWSDPFELAVRAPSSSSSDGDQEEYFVVKQQRIGNLERDRNTGWFDNRRGLQHFGSPFQIAKLRRWIADGASLAVGGIEVAPGSTKPPVRKNPNATLTLTEQDLTFSFAVDEQGRRPQGATVDPKRRSLESDVRASVSDVGHLGVLSRHPDVIFVHSGPHDRRVANHTLDHYRTDLRHMQRVLSEYSTQPVIWRSNIVGAGALYRCSKLENPWVYSAMDKAARQELLGSPSWHFLDASGPCWAFHWGKAFSDGIHYGRYQARYSKDTIVDRVNALAWWNELDRLLGHRPE